MDFGIGWQDSLPLVEFSYNNIYQVSIGMSPFEALYDRKCRSPLYWNDLSEAPIVGPDMIREMTENVKLIQSPMRAAQDRQAKYANIRRRPLIFEKGVHDVFHVSMLRKYNPDPSHVLPPDEWNRHGVEEATWELEDKMRHEYPELFK
ncbi:uncharacterized protein [Primulina eburnea]|uniref:uncharacterized protein n=1 Tax=Primulina eburnea TaxID=1245227 RepID=UPI003C6C2BAC